jgi:hypothetical protein
MIGLVYISFLHACRRRFRLVFCLSACSHCVLVTAGTQLGNYFGQDQGPVNALSECELPMYDPLHLCLQHCKETKLHLERTHDAEPIHSKRV